MGFLQDRKKPENQDTEDLKKRYTFFGEVYVTAEDIFYSQKRKEIIKKVNKVRQEIQSKTEKTNGYTDSA